MFTPPSVVLLAILANLRQARFQDVSSIRCVLVMFHTRTRTVHVLLSG